MFLDQTTREFVVVSAIGLDEEIVLNARVSFGDPIVGTVAETGKLPLLIKNIDAITGLKKEESARHFGESPLSAYPSSCMVRQWR